MKLIKDLYRLSGRSGILALENTRNNRVLLIRSTDALGAINRVLRSTKSRNKRYKLIRKDINKLTIKLVSEDNSRLSFQYWVNYYESQGYTLYHKYKAIQYRIKTEIVPKNIEEHEVLVKLVSRNRSEIVVGVFNTINEANEFIKMYYPDGVKFDIIYSSNSRTREMLSI